MSRRKGFGSLLVAVEDALRPGEFISYRRSWDFIGGLGEVKADIDALAAGGKADDAVELYELLLAGCYEKAEEIDDSGGSLGDFFQELFCCWIKARQAAGREAEETVSEIIEWMNHDEYGFCFRVEGDVAKALNREGYLLLRKHFEDRLAEAFAPFADEEPKFIFDYPTAVHVTACALKELYVGRKDAQSYVALCEKMVVSPKDCENIATLLKAKGRKADALAWVERGLAIEKDREWRNQGSYSLAGLKRELLSKVGRGSDALQSAWSEYKRCPSLHGYEELMRYVPKTDRGQWHQKAIEVARGAALDAFMDICVKTKELDLLAQRIDSEEPGKLEEISHYVTEKAAAALARKHGLAAAKIYSALGMRILNSGKSKYYPHALEHFREAKKLYGKQGQEGTWLSTVERVRADHSRKSSFIGGFEEVVAGAGLEPTESFGRRARRRWKKQTSSGRKRDR